MIKMKVLTLFITAITAIYVAALYLKYDFNIFKI